MRSFVFLLMITMLSSCSKLGFEMRRYRQGFYHDSPSQHKEDGNPLVSQQYKKTRALTRTMSVDSTLETITLPVTIPLINEVSPNCVTLTSAKKDQVKLRLPLYRTKHYATTLTKAVKAKQLYGLGNTRSKNDWTYYVFFGMMVIAALLIHFVLYPTMSTVFVVLIAMGIAILVFALVALLVY